jgi:hypothetical protein
MICEMVSLSVGTGVETTTTPSAMPPMTTNSETCRSRIGLPPAIMKPPSVAPRTMMNPMMINMVKQRQGSGFA